MLRCARNDGVCGRARRDMSAPLPRRVRGLLVLWPRDRDRRLGLCARAFHVEALVAHRDLVAAQQAHALQAARRAGRGIVLWQREGDRCGGGDKIKKLRGRLAVALGIELVGIVLSLGAAAERKLLCGRVGEIDDVGGLEGSSRIFAWPAWMRVGLPGLLPWTNRER